MGNFNRGGGGFGGGNRGGDRGGRPSFGGNRGGGRGFGGGREERGPVTMTKVTCDDCKKACEVPFRPTAGKPVYCNDCFRGQAGGREERAPRRDFNSTPAPRPSFAPANEGTSDLSKQISSLNVKLDRILSVMESMSSSKPAISKKEVVKSMTVSLAKKEVKKVAKKKTGKK